MDWLFCNSCFCKPNKSIYFYLSNCGHIFCENCVESKTKELCFICGKVCKTTQLSSFMEPDIAIYFTDLIEIESNSNKEITTFIEEKMKEIKNFVNERYFKINKVYNFQARHRNHYMKNVDEKLENHKKYEAKIQSLSEKIQSLTQDNNKLKEIITNMQAQNNKFKNDSIPMANPFFDYSNSFNNNKTSKQTTSLEIEKGQRFGSLFSSTNNNTNQPQSHFENRYFSQNRENEKLQLLKMQQENELKRRSTLATKNDEVIPSSSGFDTSKYGLSFKTPINQSISMLTNQRIPQNQNPSSRGSSISDKQEMLTKNSVCGSANRNIISSPAYSDASSNFSSLPGKRTFVGLTNGTNNSSNEVLTIKDHIINSEGQRKSKKY